MAFWLPVCGPWSKWTSIIEKMQRDKGEAYFGQKEGGRIKGEKRAVKRHRKEGGSQISPTSKPGLRTPNYLSSNLRTKRRWRKKKKEGKGEKEPTLEHLLDGRCCIRCFHICTFPEIWQWEKKHPMHGEKRELYQNTNHLCVRWWEPPFQFPTIFNHKYNMVILTL